MIFRASSIGRLMTDPKTKSEGILSKGAKTYIRELAAQEIFGVDFIVQTKYMKKGIQLEQDAIDMLNRVKFTSYVKNTDRRTVGLLTGEADIVAEDHGRDIKCSWNASTFPILAEDAYNSDYFWQMTAYMFLYDKPRWHVDYCLLSTPLELVQFEDVGQHFVDHIPENHRITTWTIERDTDLEAKMLEKLEAAFQYYVQVIHQFEEQHK